MAIKALRGMRDLLPPLSEKYLFFLENASSIAKRFGFKYIETPILEETSLFKRSVGESSDIVGKEMYQFIDKGKNDVSLRPEGTAGIVRSFIEHKLDKKEGNFRFYYHGPMFRYERPQKGRFREFHQFGVESFGEKSVYEDANIIVLTKEILEFFKIDYNLKINSLGCPKCMPNYRKKLLNFLDKVEAKVCQDCLRRKATNPIRVLDCKVDACKDIYIDAPKLLDNLCSECKSDFSTLKELLKLNNIKYEIDIFLVRGLDYYTKTAFEFVNKDIGSQNAIAGGGRFDGLVEFLGGKPTPAIGFAIGVERILDLFELPPRKRDGVYLGVMLEEAMPKAFKISSILRKSIAVEFFYQKKSLRAHLKAADRSFSKYAAIIGEDELRDNKIWLKDLEEKREEILGIEEFLKRFGRGNV